MGLLEDLLKTKKDHHDHDTYQHDVHRYEHHENHHRPQHEFHENHGHSLHALLQPLLQGTLKNKTLLVLLGAVMLIMATLAIGVLALILPLLGSVFESIDQNGIKGIVDTLFPFLERLWEGSGKGQGSFYPHPLIAQVWSA